MMLSKSARFCFAMLVGALFCAPQALEAQTYRGQRAGSVNPKGKPSKCIYSGAMISDMKHSFFSDLDGGRCIVNGAKISIQELEKDGPKDGVLELDFEGMDLSESSWVAFDFGKNDISPCFRNVNAQFCDFSAINKENQEVNRVDATSMNAANSKIHGARLTEWYVQGSNFENCDFTSVTFSAWHSDAGQYAYEKDPELFRNIAKEGGLIQAAPDDQRFRSGGANYYNCEFVEECNLSGGDFSGTSFILTKVGQGAYEGKGSSMKWKGDDTFFHGSNFASSYLNETSFLGVDFSGTSFTNARIDNCEFTGCQLKGANFSGARLRDCVFFAPIKKSKKGEIEPGTPFSLDGVSFAGATLDGVDFSGMDLSKCDFTDAITNNLIGDHPSIPEDFVIEPTKSLTEIVGTDTLEVPTYKIVVGEGRYEDGLREKRQ